MLLHLLSVCSYCIPLLTQQQGFVQRRSSKGREEDCYCTYCVCPYWSNNSKVSSKEAQWSKEGNKGGEIRPRSSALKRYLNQTIPRPQLSTLVILNSSPKVPVQITLPLRGPRSQRFGRRFSCRCRGGSPSPWWPPRQEARTSPPRHLFAIKVTEQRWLCNPMHDQVRFCIKWIWVN